MDPRQTTRPKSGVQLICQKLCLVIFGLNEITRKVGLAQSIGCRFSCADLESPEHLAYECTKFNQPTIDNLNLEALTSKIRKKIVIEIYRQQDQQSFQKEQIPQQFCFSSHRLERAKMSDWISLRRALLICNLLDVSGLGSRQVTWTTSLDQSVNLTEVTY